MKKIVGLVSYLLLALFAMNIHAECKPILILIRHAEDPASYTKEYLLTEGIYHAMAYIDLFKDIQAFGKLIHENEVCPIKTVYAMGTGKPEETAQIIAQGKQRLSQCRDLTTVPLLPNGLPPGLNVPCKLWQEGQPLLTADGSAILVLNQQTIQQDFLKKAVNDKASQDLIQFFGPSAVFNGVWVFTGGLDIPFQNLSIWVQEYDYDRKTKQCNFRLSIGDPEVRIRDIRTLKISGLKPVEKIPNWKQDWQGYQLSQDKCTMDNRY